MCSEVVQEIILKIFEEQGIRTDKDLKKFETVKDICEMLQHYINIG